MKESRATRFFENLVVVLLCLAVSTCDSASWLQKEPQSFIFSAGEQVDINCTLDDPNINVTLWFANVSEQDTYREIVPDARIQQDNQIFKLSKMKISDVGQYECRAENMTLFDVLRVHMSNDSASWLQKKALGFIFYVGEQVDINCTLDDPNINVTLWFAKVNDQGVHGAFREIVPNARIQQDNQIFTLSKMEISDDGQYECRAENVAPLLVLRVHMSNAGIPKPRPKISSKPFYARYGEKMKFDCSAKGSVVLNWYKRKRNGTRKDWKWMKSLKEKNPRRNGRLITRQSLTIEKFNVSDNGVYICELERKNVKWRTYTEKYVNIGDFQMPTFTSFPKPLEIANEGEWVYWGRKYTVKGIPTPSITWYKVNDNNENVNEVLYSCSKDDCVAKDGYDIDRSYFGKDHLSFPDDNSTYKCVATNSLGTVTKTFRLNVLAEPKIAVGKKTISVYKDSSSTDLVCRVEKANPSQITFTWQAQLTACTNSDDCQPNNSNWRTITGKESGLQMVTNHAKSTITIKQSEQHVFYRCVAKTAIGEDQFVWTVIPATGPRPLKAVQNVVEVDEKEDVKLACEVARFTSTLVHWKYNNVILDLSPRMRVENSTRNGTVYNTLHIKNVNVTDAGKYECFGEFSGSALAAEIQLKVRVLKEPIVSLKKLTAKQDSSFFFRCNVTGYPKPRITWKKDDKVVKPREALDSSSPSRACMNRQAGIYLMTNGDKDYATALLICKADFRHHSGQFSCTARNRLGNDSASAFINITAPPKISELAEPEMELGEKFFLKCNASGNPTPRVWWEKKDKISSRYKPVKNQPREELSFDVLDKSNIGNYRCLAQNGFGNASIEFILDPKPSALAAHVPPNNSKKYAVVIGCVSFFILMIVIIVAVILYKRKKIYGGFYILTLPPLTDYIKKLDPHKPLTEQTNKLPYDAEWEFPRNRLKFSRELGSGAFGKVYLADAMGIVAFDPRGSTKRRSTRRRFGGSGRRSNHYVNNNKMTKVAVKTLKEDSGEAEYKDLLSELKILIHVGEHKNIVNLLGACTKGRESELWVIIEFCSNGNLLQFLRNRRDIYETEWKGISKDPNFQLTMTDLVIAAYQIARGMEFLASRMCIHRDLATRNILMTDNYVIKIADFGLARDVGEESQYVKTSTGLLPIKWMAIEAIIQRLFTEKSDVWSFGIVLWELFTLGGTPYPNISPNEVAEFLARGLRMEPPHACPDEISSLMMNCWHEDKDCRPTFKELVEILDKIIELHTSSEGGRGYLEVQGEVMNEYLSPSEVKSPQMNPFECNSPLPPIPSPGENERDSLLLKDQNARGRKFDFDKAVRNKAARQDSEIEKIKNDHRPEIAKEPDVKRLPGNDLDGYIDTSLTGKEKERIEQELEKDRDSSEEPQHLSDYAYWKKSLV